MTLASQPHAPAPKCHAESHPETSSYPSCPGADQAKALEEQCKEMKVEETEESEGKTELEKEIALLPEAGKQKSSDVAGVREEGSGEKSAQACEHCSNMSDISAEMPTGNSENMVQESAKITATEPTEAGQGPPEDQKCCVVANHEDWFKGRPDIVVPVDNLAAEDIKEVEELEQRNTGVQGNLAEDEAKEEIGTADECISFNQGHASKDRESAELKDLSVSFCGKKRKRDVNEDPKTRCSIASDMADESKGTSPFVLSADCSGDDAIKDKASVTDDAELRFDAKEEVGETPGDGQMIVSSTLQLTFEENKALGGGETAVLCLASAQPDKEIAGPDTPSASGHTQRTDKKKCRGRGRNGLADNESARLFIAGMIKGHPYSAKIVHIDVRVVGQETARVRMDTSSATGRLQMSTNSQLTVGQQVSVRLLRKFVDKPTWFDVELDPDVHGFSQKLK
jgi:hypothetical protein